MLQRDIIESEEKTFTAGLSRSYEQDLASIERLETTLSQDDEIIAFAKRFSPKPVLVTPKRSSPPPSMSIDRLMYSLHDSPAQHIASSWLRLALTCSPPSG